MPQKRATDRSGFNFTTKVREVCNDFITRLPELQHIDLPRVAMAFAQARNRSAYGTYATLTPMRFREGALFTRRRGQKYTVQRLYDDDGAEQLYILTFYMPRFMDVDLIEKLTTILHELWHISPEFNGDIRRFPGRCYAHSSSQKDYDAEMEVLAKKWLEMDPPEETYSFLRFQFDELRRSYGRVYGTKIKHPKLVRCA